MNNRYCLKQDEDLRWYVVPLERESEFETMCSEAYRTDFFNKFYREFECMRLERLDTFSFIDPREDAA